MSLSEADKWWIRREIRDAFYRAHEAVMENETSKGEEVPESYEEATGVIDRALKAWQQELEPK